jgi:hypothetical protein
MTGGSTLEAMAATALDTQLTELQARLVEEYGSDREETVRALMDDERDRFADARVHAFVPILVERSARSRLDDA